MVTKKRRATSDELTSAGRVAVLLEEMQGQIQAVLEAVQSSERRIIDKFELRFQKIELRLDALEFAVRKNSEDIRKNSEDIRKNSEDIQNLRAEARRLNDMLEGDREENAIQALERRVERLEHQLGGTSTPGV